MKKEKKEQKSKRTSRAWVDSGNIARIYKGTEHKVQVTAENGKVKIALYDGKTFKSLSAVARVITGYQAISGPAFFGLGKKAVAA